MSAVVVLWFVLMVGVGAAMAPCSTDYSSIASAIAALDASTFPTRNFNAECLQQACPDLSRAQCPFNQTALPFLLATVQSCLSQRGAICATPIDPIPLCTAGLSLQDSLPTLPVSGRVYNVAGKGFLLGLNATALASGPGGLYVTVSSPALQYSSQFEGNVVLGAQNVSLGPMPFAISINLTQVLGLNSSSSKWELLSTAINVDTEVGDMFDSSEKLNPVAAAFTQVLVGQVQNIFQSSPFPRDFSRFVGAILDNAIKAASSHCKD